MIKFVIGLIALIFVALAVYTYTDKKAEVVPKSAVTHDVVKKEVAETKLSQPVKVAKEVNSKNEVISQDLKLKKLENRDDELAFGDTEYRPDENPSSSEVLTSEELEVIERDMDISSHQSEGNTMDTNLSFVETNKDLSNSNFSDTTLLTEKEFSEIEEGMDIPIAEYHGKIKLENEIFE